MLPLAVLQACLVVSWPVIEQHLALEKISPGENRCPLRLIIVVRNASDGSLFILECGFECFQCSRRLCNHVCNEDGAIIESKIYAHACPASGCSYGMDFVLSDLQWQHVDLASALDDVVIFLKGSGHFDCS